MSDCDKSTFEICELHLIKSENGLTLGGEGEENMIWVKLLLQIVTYVLVITTLNWYFVVWNSASYN